MSKASVSAELNMFYGAPVSSFVKARHLRDNATEAEKILWNKLKGKHLGVKFRRQHPIDIYIADFYCHEIKLVIEVDGDYHLNSMQADQDSMRSEDIRSFGIEVIRFSNHQVFEQIDQVINEIKQAIDRYKIKLSKSSD